MKRYTVAVVGATGLVGRKMTQVLEERRFPVGELRLLASARSAGKTVPFARNQVPVLELTAGSFAGVEIALFSAGAAVSREFAPHAVRAGTLVVDNSSGFRLDAGVPLVVPEVNRGAIFRHRGIVANPNCSTIIAIMPLWPIHRKNRIQRQGRYIHSGRSLKPI